VEGTSRLPLPALTPVEPETKVVPADAEASVGAVALPAGTSLLVCDEKCVADVLSRSGVQSGSVEVAFGADEWQEAEGSVVVPAGSSTLRVRVVPETGDPVEYAAIITREDLNNAYGASVGGEVRTEVEGAPLSADDGTNDGSGSFPWWIIVLVVVVLAVVGYAERRRRAAKAQSTN
ncbi:MAG: hypothetical protein RLY50_874, partial [Actinomycetota bacterium]